MADGERRGFLKKQVGGSAAFLAGLVTGGAAGAAGMRAHKDGSRSFAEKAEHSYAQQGEDLVLWNILHHFLGTQSITYLDVGAHHPVESNNTYLFYERGYRGVLVEPNPALWELLSGLRPRDALIRGGIGIDGKDTEADYYVITDHGGLNTFSKEMADSYAGRTDAKFSIKKVLRLPLVDINGVMQKYFGGPPSLLSLDTEGFELPILQSIDWKRYRPSVLCVDTLEFNARRVRSPILEFMTDRGYDIRGATFVNTIFVDRRHIF